MKVHLHKKLVYFVLIHVVIFTLISCNNRENTVTIDDLYFSEENVKSLVTYAEGFNIYENDGVTKLVIYNPKNRSEVLSSIYFTESGFFIEDKTGIRYSDVPENVAVFSATQLSAFSRMNILDKVGAISESDYIQNQEVIDLYNSGKIVSLASNGNFFLEKTLEVNPEIIFYSPYNMAQSHPLAITEIIMVPFFDFLESDPLGRAEWIKFTALFFNKEDIARDIFDSIVFKYNSLKELAGSVEYRPTVFSDKYYSGQWFIPGGKSYIARMLDHAGADYLWSDNDKSGSMNIDFEVVYKKAHNADFWRIVGTYPDGFTYEKLGEENNLYINFDAYSNRKVVFCDSRSSSYFEKGTLEPHILLADLIFAFHPDLLHDYEPTYYFHYK